jgi:aryl-alcohol dehydrogenase-like predicted oxidoreductase
MNFGWHTSQEESFKIMDRALELGTNFFDTADVYSEQSIYHLNNRMLELEVIPACRHYGLGLIPWSPLGGGLLAGALEKLESGRRTSEESLKEINKNRPKLEQYEALCKQLGTPPAAVALAWLLNNPIVTAPIIGPRTIEQLESTLRATEITLDGEILESLDEISQVLAVKRPRPTLGRL